MKTIKHIKALVLIFVILGLPFVGYSQHIPVTVTQFSRTNNEEIGKEYFSFSMLDGKLTIIDLDNSTTETYGPLKYEGSGFEGGCYYIGFTSDIQQDPLRYRYEKPRAYKVYYSEKNGSILAILEGKIRQDNAQIIKIYYTNLGNEILNKSN